ncbi:MAG: glycoside hydrolase domain-containing protein [Planctomycetota bacterium]
MTLKKNLVLFALSLAFCAALSAQTTRKAQPLYEPLDSSSSPLPPEVQAAWQQSKAGLQGAMASVDIRYRRNEPPLLERGDSSGNRSWSGTAWRGERVHAQLVLWSKEPLQQLRFTCSSLCRENQEPLPPASLTARFVRYTLGDQGLQPDILDTTQSLDMPGMSVRPLWVTMEIPRDAAVGTYQGQLAVRAKGHEPLVFDFRLEVLPWTLPEPSKQSFHLDLWQNPWAIARYHHVEPWSEAHFSIMEPHLRLLVEAGQKVLTATIVHQPWGTQTFDPYGSMVEWIRAGDGTFTFDYTVFDRWVEFGMRIGLDQAVNCYSTVPWSNQVRYREAETGDYATMEFKAGDSTYQEIWPPFLKDFSRHLSEKGWIERVCLAMDERPPKQMRPAIALIREHAPALKIALAGGNYPELEKEIHDWCVYITPPLRSELICEREARNREKGTRLETTFYVCCGPEQPNTFTDSPPAESAWLGWYAAARGFTGFLRWAYDSWVEEPMLDTRHVTWAAGDCFLVYPGARSSIRFERLREGIQAFEKVRILRAYASSSEKEEVRKAMDDLDSVLERITYDRACRSPAADAVHAATATVERISRELSIDKMPCTENRASEE